MTTLTTISTVTETGVGLSKLYVFMILWKYRVIHKKLSYKTEDKMQEKLKMILQVDENLAHI